MLCIVCKNIGAKCQFKPEYCIISLHNATPIYNNNSSEFVEIRIYNYYIAIDIKFIKHNCLFLKTVKVKRRFNLTFYI